MTYEKNNNITPTQVGVRYGLFSGLASVIISLVSFIADLRENSAIGILSTAVTIAFLVMAMKYFRDQNSGFMKFGQGFGIGMIVSAISSLLSGAFLIVYFKFINSKMLDEISDKAHQEWEKAGLDDKQIAMAEKFISAEFMFLTAVFGGLIFGAILSLIVAAIMQKKQPEF
ncbi:MAG: DUF4199 domain-containing protein [Raineya sp.]